MCTAHTQISALVKDPIWYGNTKTLHTGNRMGSAILWLLEFPVHCNGTRKLCNLNCYGVVIILDWRMNVDCEWNSQSCICFLCRVDSSTVPLPLAQVK